MLTKRELALREQPKVMSEHQDTSNQELINNPETIICGHCKKVIEAYIGVTLSEIRECLRKTLNKPNLVITETLCRSCRLKEINQDDTTRNSVNTK